MSPTAPNRRLSDLPLWRLLVALHDAEEVAGPDSESAEIIRQEMIRRLDRRDRRAGVNREGVRDGR
jgi:hypothetical protein